MAYNCFLIDTFGWILKKQVRIIRSLKTLQWVRGGLSYFLYKGREVKWNSVWREQWQAIGAIAPITQYSMTHAGRHCFMPNAVSSHLPSFEPKLKRKWKRTVVTLDSGRCHLISTHMSQSQSQSSTKWTELIKLKNDPATVQIPG